MSCRAAGFPMLGVVGLLAVGAVLVSVGGCRSASAERTLSAELRVPDRPLTLETRFRHGSMTVRGFAADGERDAPRARWRVDARVKVWADDQETADAVAADLVVDADVEGDRLRVRIVPQSARWDDDEYRLAITSTWAVPSRTALDVSTTHGALRIEDLRADVVGRTTHGGVTVRRVDGDVDCRTTHGPIHAEALRGVAHRLVTTHGRAQVLDVDGTLEVRTTHGPIVADLGAVRRGESRLHTTHGTVICRVAAGSDVTIAASTTHGGVRCSVPGAQTDLGEGAGHVRIGDGRGSVAIRTTHGRVSIEPSSAPGRARPR